MKPNRGNRLHTDSFCKCVRSPVKKACCHVRPSGANMQAHTYTSGIVSGISSESRHGRYQLMGCPLLVYRNDWRTVWIVSWVVYAVVAGLPLLYNLIPARITQPFEDAIMKPFRRGPAVVRRTRASDESGSSRQDKAVSLVEVHEL